MVRVSGIASPDGGWHPPMARSEMLRGRGVQPSSGRTSRCPCGERQPPMAWAHRLGNRESNPAGGRSIRCTFRGKELPVVQTHKIGGWGFKPDWPSQLTVPLWGIGAPNGAASQDRGRWIPA